MSCIRLGGVALGGVSLQPGLPSSGCCASAYSDGSTLGLVGNR